jgi:hypothetical protein
MNKRIEELWNKAAQSSDSWESQKKFVETLAQLVVQDCIDKIETYRIPVGNSASGELACEWTYAALKEIRDDIKDTFGIEDA